MHCSESLFAGGGVANNAAIDGEDGEDGENIFSFAEVISCQMISFIGRFFVCSVFYQSLFFGKNIYSINKVCLHH